MKTSERHFIALCKQQIEQKFSFGNGQGHTQRDLEIFSKYIQEKTGVNVSLSTLKRLWKDDYKHSPQLATLNALAVMLDYKDWQSFKSANKHSETPAKSPTRWIVSVIIILAIIGMILSRSFYPDKTHNSVTITGPVQFETSTTVTSGIPNTVIFKYDVSHIDADTIYIQQSWNANHRIGLDPRGKAVTSIYYESGYHRARLMANDSLIAMRPIHIISNGWEPHLYYSEADLQPIDFKNEEFITNGQLNLDSSMLKQRKIDYSKRFFTRISNSQIFDVHSDNFSFLTRLKVDRVFNQLCPWMTLIIVTDVHIFRVSLNDTGCENHNSYKLGEISKSGSNNDLSALGCDVHEWQELEVRVKDKRATISLNGKSAYTETYTDDLGKIVGLVYIFDGTGSIDYALLRDGNEKVVFEDMFDHPSIHSSDVSD